jgi:hypothetical protein
MKRRREFITLLGGAAAWPSAARAQQGRWPTIGLLSTGTRSTQAPRVAAFVHRLHELRDSCDQLRSDRATTHFEFVASAHGSNWHFATGGGTADSWSLSGPCGHRPTSQRGRFRPC